MLRNDWIGETIGARYQIDELLGQDGLSSTYRATDVDLRQAVAIKIIHPYLSIDPGFLRRFQEEAPAIARLRHPHIVRITDYDHDSGRYFLVHELVPGETLQNRLSRLQAQKQLLPVEKAIEIAIQICDAVHYTHRRGSVHREIKPASIMLDINGEALLMDFGMAWILDGQSQLMNGAMLSKAIYMSPEQIKGEKLDRRTDIYSLGVVLFEMVCGRPPFEAGSANTVMLMHVHDPVPDLHRAGPPLHQGLVKIINKALAKNPAARYQTAAEMSAELSNLLARLHSVYPPGVAVFQTPEINELPFNPFFEDLRDGWVSGPDGAAPEVYFVEPEIPPFPENEPPSNPLITGGIVAIVLLVAFIALGGLIFATYFSGVG